MNENCSPWAGKRVLVTGCTGFLGGAVAAELLAQGAEVVGLVRDRTRGAALARLAAGRVHLVYGCVENGFRLHTAMAIHEVAAVFHLAAIAPTNERRVTHAVLEAAKLYSPDTPVVVSRPLAAPAPEPHPLLNMARFDVVFGPGDRAAARAVPATASALVTGAPVPLPADGPAHDFVFVSNAADACLRVAEAALGRGPGEYTFRSGWSLTDRQMCAIVSDTFAGRVPPLPEFAPVENPLGWHPRESFTDALSETLEWYCATGAGVFDGAALQKVA